MRIGTLPSRQAHITTAGFVPPDLIMVHMEDITNRRKAEEAIHRANRQITLLNTITRHDILNNITCILGYLQLTEMDVNDPRLSMYLAKMESATTDIKSQIEFARIYQDLGTLEPQWIKLEPILPYENVPPTIILNADIQGVELFADPMLEKKFNLLDNSIQHGQRVSEIQISSYQLDDELVVIWEDNGVGIIADEKERVFKQRFEKNTGLGMFLIREILSLTGITIRETGEPGNGARFEMTVPNGVYRFISV